MSANGSQWTDLTTVAGCDQANVCLKAFTRPAGTDATAPTTTVIPANDYEVGYWNNAPCDFTFTAATTRAARESARLSTISTARAGRCGSSGATFTVPAPADHTNDGQQTFLVRSTDVAGNAETPQSFSLAIERAGRRRRRPLPPTCGAAPTPR